MARVSRLCTSTEWTRGWKSTTFVTTNNRLVAFIHRLPPETVTNLFQLLLCCSSTHWPRSQNKKKQLTPTGNEAIRNGHKTLASGRQAKHNVAPRHPRCERLNVSTKTGRQLGPVRVLNVGACHGYAVMWGGSVVALALAASDDAQQSLSHRAPTRFLVSVPIFGLRGGGRKIENFNLRGI